MDFETLLEGFETTIKKLSYNYYINPLEPSDIAQELRLHLFKKFNLYDDKRNFNDWAFIICKRKLIDLLRDYKRNNRSGYLSIDYLKEKGNKL